MDKWVCGPIKTVIVAPSTNPARTSMGNLLQHVSMKLTGQGARNDKIHHLVKVPDTETCNTAKTFSSSPGCWTSDSPSQDRWNGMDNFGGLVITVAHRTCNAKESGRHRQSPPISVVKLVGTAFR